MFSRAWHRLHVFPRSAQVACFPALGTSCMFSRAWHRLHVFPRLAQVASFPALGTGCMFSRAWHRLLVFQRLLRLHVFPSLVSLATVLCLLGFILCDKVNGKLQNVSDLSPLIGSLVKLVQHVETIRIL